jgi:hypothetical protein
MSLCLALLPLMRGPSPSLFSSTDSTDYTDTNDSLAALRAAGMATKVRK